MHSFLIEQTIKINAYDSSNESVSMDTVPDHAFDVLLWNSSDFDGILNTENMSISNNTT